VSEILPNLPLPAGFVTLVLFNKQAEKKGGRIKGKKERKRKLTNFNLKLQTFDCYRGYLTTLVLLSKSLMRYANKKRKKKRLFVI
jgi:hypothetical protein